MSQEPPLDSRCDRDLLACFVADGRQEAFAALIRRHGDMVLRVCRARLGNSPMICRSAYRPNFAADICSNYNGFRVVVTVTR